MANHARTIELAASERIELERLQRSSSAPAGLSRRARAVLLMAGDVSGVEVARLTGYTPIQISRIRRRYAEQGLAGLMDRPRSGRPPQLTEAKRARIVALTLKAPPKGLTHWSTRELGERVGVSHATVHRIWQAHALQPHRVETFKFTSDPRAEAKIHDVVGLYLNPPTNAVVLSLDEKTQIQALERTQPLLPLRSICRRARPTITAATGSPACMRPSKWPPAKSSVNAPSAIPARTSCASSRSCTGAIADANCT